MCKYNDAVEIQNCVTRRKCFQPQLPSPLSLRPSVCVSRPSVSLADLRAQLTDQIKILDSQVEVKQQQLSDLSDFLRRRGDIEAEYARALDKLTERFTHKTKK